MKTRSIAAVMAAAKDSLSEDEMMEREREEFMKAIHRTETTARIEHMLETGKPLVN